jgi:hypothetical protein
MRIKIVAFLALILASNAAFAQSEWFRDPALKYKQSTGVSAPGCGPHYIAKAKNEQYLFCPVGFLPGDAGVLYSLPALVIATSSAQVAPIVTGSASTLYGGAWKGAAISDQLGRIITGNGDGTTCHASLPIGNPCVWTKNGNVFSVTNEGSASTGIDGMAFSHDSQYLYSDLYNPSSDRNKIRRWSVGNLAAGGIGLTSNATFVTSLGRVRNVGVYYINGQDLIYYGEGNGGGKVCVMDPATGVETVLVNSGLPSGSVAYDIMNVKVAGVQSGPKHLYVQMDGGALHIFDLAADGKSAGDCVKAFTSDQLQSLLGASWPNMRAFEVLDNETHAFFSHHWGNGGPSTNKILVYVVNNVNNLPPPPTNAPPVANAQSVTTPSATATNLTLTGTDPESTNLFYTVVTPPAHGTLSGTAPNVTYTPATNYIGADNFTFQVNDGALDSTPATVSISVTPIAVDLDIDGVSSGNTFSPGQGGFLAKGGWVMITLDVEGARSARLSWSSEKIAIYTATNGTALSNPTDWPDASTMPSTLWVYGVEASASGPTATNCGPEHITLEAINNGASYATPYVARAGFTVVAVTFQAGTGTNTQAITNVTTLLDKDAMIEAVVSPASAGGYIAYSITDTAKATVTPPTGTTSPQPLTVHGVSTSSVPTTLNAMVAGSVCGSLPVTVDEARWILSHWGPTSMSSSRSPSRMGAHSMASASALTTPAVGETDIDTGAMIAIPDNEQHHFRYRAGGNWFLSLLGFTKTVTWVGAAEESNDAGFSIATNTWATPGPYVVTVTQTSKALWFFTLSETSESVTVHVIHIEFAGDDTIAWTASGAYNAKTNLTVASFNTNSVSWSITTVTGATAAINSGNGAVTLGSGGGEYSITATSADLASETDTMTLTVPKVDIEMVETNVCCTMTNATLNLTAASYGGGGVTWTSSPAGLSVVGYTASTFTFNPSNSTPTSYVVTAWASALTNCMDTATVNVYRVELTPKATNVCWLSSAPVEIVLTNSYTPGGITWSGTNGLKVVSATDAKLVFTPTNSTPTNYVVKAASVGSPNCYDVCTVTILKVEIEEIHFDHNTSAMTDDGVTIKKNKDTDVTAPEWKPATSKNDPACYIKSKTPKVKVKLKVHPNTITTAKVRAVGKNGKVPNLTQITVTFTGGASGLEEFTMDTAIPDTVTNILDSWQWKISDVNGSGSVECDIGETGEHKVFVVFDTPKVPMGKPWVSVLENACKWAATKADEAGSIGPVTTQCYDEFFSWKSYDGGVPSHATSDTFHLTTFLGDDATDCQDMSAYVYCAMKALGSQNVKTRVIDGGQDGFWFKCQLRTVGAIREKYRPGGTMKRYPAVGDPDSDWSYAPFTGSWAIGCKWVFHQVVFLADKVYDPTSKIKGSATVPAGVPPADYKNTLYHSGPSGAGQWNEHVPEDKYTSCD